MAPTSVRQTSVSVRENEPRGSINDLRQQHANILTRAVFNILSTPAARLTYAQIIDGVPLSHIIEDVGNFSHWICPMDHPARTHFELCPGALDRTEAICGTFNLNVLKFDIQLLQAYCATEPSSTEFETRLVEMVVVGIHQIAAYLYKLDLDLGSHKDITTRASPDTKLPTLFVHRQYRDFDQYPNGIADMVGYWAEAQIFGGVVLFDRNKPAKDNVLAASDAIFFHSNHKDVTYRIWKLLDTQRQDLVRFLLSDQAQRDTASCPLPVRADSSNVTRVDPEEPVCKTGIYRDLWERKPLGDHDWDRRLGCTSYNSLDYTSHEDYERSRERGGDRRFEIDIRHEAQVHAEIEAEKLEMTYLEYQEAQNDLSDGNSYISD